MLFKHSRDAPSNCLVDASFAIAQYSSSSLVTSACMNGQFGHNHEVHITLSELLPGLVEALTELLNVCTQLDLNHHATARTCYD